MSESCFFVDIQRGIFVTNDGKLYFTDYNTKKVRFGPLMFQVPMRILTSEAYDPYFILITSDGILYLMSHEQKRVIESTQIPAKVGVIESLTLDQQNQTISLKTTHGVFVYKNGHWETISEPIETLITNQDTKVSAQCMKLENEMAHAVEENLFEAYSKAVSTYLVYIATYLPSQVFITTWYSIIHSELPFDPEATHALWAEIIGLLSSCERIASLLDELDMSLKMPAPK